MTGMPLPEEDKDIYNHGRKGDTLMVPFQCQLCHFRNMKGRNSVVESDKDYRLLSFIKQANLDSFWSRTMATVEGNYKQVCKLVVMGFWGLMCGKVCLLSGQAILVHTPPNSSRKHPTTQQ